MADTEHGPSTWAQIGGSLIGAAAVTFVIGGLEVANQEKVRPFDNNWIRVGCVLAAVGTTIVVGAGISAGKSWRRSRRKARHQRLRRALSAIARSLRRWSGWPSRNASLDLFTTPLYGTENGFDAKAGTLRLRIWRTTGSGDPVAIAEVYDYRIKTWIRSDPKRYEMNGAVMQNRYPEHFPDAPNGPAPAGKYGVRWITQLWNADFSIVTGERVIAGPEWFDTAAVAPFVGSHRTAQTRVDNQLPQAAALSFSERHPPRKPTPTPVTADAKAVLKAGLALFDELPRTDPDSLASVRAIASGLPRPPGRSEVEAWESDALRFISPVDHDYFNQKINTPLEFAFQMAAGKANDAALLRERMRQRLNRLAKLIERDERSDP